MFDARDHEYEEPAEGEEYEFDTLVRETESAWLIEIGSPMDADAKQYWLPKSQVDLSHASKTVVVPDWLATEKGLA